MRIEAYGHISGSTPLRPKAKSSGTGFSLETSQDVGTASDVGGPVAQQSVSLGALLSLQSSETDTLEQRAVANGNTLLDELSKLHAALAGGDDVPELLMLLRERLPELQLTGDGLLDPILREIDLRVRVELAKRGL